MEKKYSPKCSNFYSSLIFSQILPNHSQVAERESQVSIFSQRRKRRMAEACSGGGGSRPDPREKAQHGGWEQASQSNQEMQIPACHRSTSSTCSLSLCCWPSCSEVTLLSWMCRRVRGSVQSLPWRLELRDGGLDRALALVAP